MSTEEREALGRPEEIAYALGRSEEIEIEIARAWLDGRVASLYISNDDMMRIARSLRNLNTECALLSRQLREEKARNGA